MKPNFALSLSFEGIKLLHRAAGGWREVGEVDVAAEDLAGELAMLRKTAASLEPAGVRTKLLIPESQIKYLTIETPDLSDVARRKAAEVALHDATPYEISELAYDISVDGPKTHVAAVAHETLAEAEAFATEHRFHPVSFVAVPGDAPYLGEPFFGPTKGAASLLEDGENVEPDGIAVVVVGAITPESLNTAEIEATPEDVTNPDAADTSKNAPEPAEDKDGNDDAAQPEFALTPEDTKSSGNKTGADQPDAAQAPTNAAEPEAASPPAQNAADLDTSAKTKPDGDARGAAAPPEADANAEDTADKESDEPSAKATEPDVAVDPARAALLAAAAASGPAKGIASKPLTAKVSPNAPVPAPPAEAQTGFASRRNGAPAGAKPVGSAQRSAANPPGPDSSSLSKPAPAPPVDAQSNPAAAPTFAPALAAASERIKSGFLSRRKPRTGAAAPLAAPAVAVPATGSEAERMTVFGARSAEVGGKPRFLGLIMTVVLLVFLAGVAAWAAVFLDDGIAGLLKEDEGRATASAPENQIDPEIIRTPEGIETAQSEGEANVQIAALDPVLSAEDTAVLDALQDPRPEPEIPVITEAEAAARYAVSGIWPLAPETPLTAPETPVQPVYRSGLDPVSTASDAFALPAPQQFDTDIQLAAVVSPPPFGQTTSRDANGLIVPSPDGVVTPEGYTLVAASPPLKPPATLTRFASPTIVEPAAVSVLAAFRPQNRPLGLSERTERAQLGGVTLGELAVYRPTLRPPSIQERAREAEEAIEEEEEANAAAAAQAAQAAQVAAAAAASALIVPQPAVAATAPVLQNATRLATPQSKRPDTRPRNFARIVQRAQRAAPAEETLVASAATVAPRTVTPNVPSKASVSRSATVKNAINLRKVNLIGVYGKPSSRRALVRLANGRYQKVKVGDRIDGGRVSAIGNSELRYAKGGRNVVLKMP